MTPLALAVAAGLALSPAPGTPDASPKTQISVLGVKARGVLGIAAVGSATGAHAGRLRAYSGDRGVSFLPDRPFAEGERVRVTLRRGGRPVSWSFTVARAGTTPPILTIATRQPDKLEHFVSAPALLAPQLTVRRAGGEAAGSLFLTPLPSPVVHPESNNAVSISPVGPGGPMISDAQGRLVWFRQLTPPEVAANLRV